MKSMEDYRRHCSQAINLFLLCGIALLGACATFGVPPAQSTEQSIAYLYPAIGTVRDVAASALVAKKISKAEATNVLAVTDNARTTADTARNCIRQGNTVCANASLELARGVIQQARKAVGLPEDAQLR